MVQKLIFGFLLVVLVCANSYCQSVNRSKPVNLIFDTDIGPDYDDVGAITLMHALADSGQVNILATIASDKYAKVSQVLQVFNTYFNRPNIPIAVPKGKAVDEPNSQHWSDSIVARYPHRLKSNAEVPDAVNLYRQILAKQPDKSVTIVSVGFFTNLANLLASKPDQYSRLSGKELITQKVKQLVSMAGKFPQGKEFNVYKDAEASIKALNNWPTTIIFSGFEIGEKVKTGLPLIHNQNIANNPTKDVYRISIPKAEEDKNGRMSWDQTAVLVAIKGAEPYYTLKPGRIIVNADGSNTWDATKKGHYYIIEKKPVAEVTAYIDKLMMHQPVRRK